MATRQRILRIRRDYNRWVADETMEDYALRFTAVSARKWSAFRVANTALGSISFLALEAIGGALTVAYGFTNSVAAILFVSALIFVASLPICLNAARAGVDIDLLTRGAGFGYIGSTITSLIYASFTFIFFGIEAVILADMLESFFGVPLWLGYLASAVVVVPLVTHGITFISRVQTWTQPVWLVLNVLPLIALLVAHPDWLEGWTHYAGEQGRAGFDLLAFGAAASVLFALITQTGEQVDYIRFLPPRDTQRPWVWWAALLAGGPGWIAFDVLKLLAGSALAYAALQAGLSATQAVQPAEMYRLAFGALIASPGVALAVTAAFVALSQIKINVTNAYAGSLAWSNFFSRLTHSHPGRVVWLVFNIAVALLLMELGVYNTIEQVLFVYSNVAAAWMGALVADLAVNKPLGLSPSGIEFKRAHLYDVNPVGVGSMALSVLASFLAYYGVLGAGPQAFATFIAFGTAFAAAPAIAWATGGRYYLARKPRAAWAARPALQCVICEHAFEPRDMAYCPVYTGPICSLCCTLDARCGDGCKPHARLSAQIMTPLRAALPEGVMRALTTPVGSFMVVFLAFVATISLVFLGIRAQTPGSPHLDTAFWKAFFVLAVIGGIVAWTLVLARQSRLVAQEETRRQTSLLMSEIRAHKRTDAALQKAKEVAERANQAKSRYVIGISHELRSPLNAILGYAQLLERDPAIPERRRDGVRTIRRSGEHLAALIEGLLDISKIEAGRIELYRDEVRLPEFLDQIVQMLRLQAEAKSIAFAFDAPERMPEVVHTDERRLRQILINLLSNAIKFTRAGGVTLRLRFRSEVAEFAVIDTGIGIAEADLARIFEPFQRGENSHAPSTPGVGLGLTITKTLTEVMGGEISVRSTLGEGSTFRVRLLLSGKVGAPVLPERRVTGRAGARRLDVLVADDDPAHRALIADLLAPLGFTVRLAADGAECLRLAEDRAPDLFLLDIAMPGMTGWELARRLREEALQEAPIIMVSANALELGPPPGRRDGTRHHDDVLPKPLSIPALLEKVGVLLGITWTFAEAEPPPAPPAGAAARLTPAQAANLRQLAAIGYVGGIRERLDALEAECPEAAPAIAVLRGHVSEYRLDAFLAALPPEAAFPEPSPEAAHRELSPEATRQGPSPEADPPKPRPEDAE
ncbi:hybrid sensor histidine kinase/response regulator [Teichococcus aestuarii]|uniref:histidine kinase n=1 Tax=Teichococcus aestuarii TaxID=568898 RepID=A0A2U1V5Q3_9PROT|nr:ATP-binding protein [Pseudoroseomonas aestuarii]PWC29249.1 hybrid sensor histidine kinase/response regulator [Pseudoroseomonas aestuarii]